MNENAAVVSVIITEEEAIAAMAEDYELPDYDVFHDEEFWPS